MTFRYPLAGDLAAGTSTTLVANPTYHANPPWITELVGVYFDELEEKVPPAWLPKLENVRPSPKGKRVTAELNELGCGAYGCVLPTLDKDVVLKITTDTTESEFAVKYSDKLVAPVCVRYLMVISLSDRHKGFPLHMLWREAADHVGGVERVLGRAARAIIDQQALLAGSVFRSIHQHDDPSLIRAGVRDLLEYLDMVARENALEPLRDLFRGMAKVLRDQGILFGDVHSGNVGLVHGRWVIVDPGNVAVI